MKRSSVADEALSEKNNLLNAAKLSALDENFATIEFSPDGTIFDANKNFLNAVGYSLDEIKGKHHAIFCTPELTKSIEYTSFWKKLAAGDAQNGEFMRVKKDGRIIWLTASYTPMRDSSGKVVRVIKFAQDTTCEKMRNAEFEGKINAISKAQAVIEFNLDGTIIWANDNFLDAMGYSLDEIKGKHHRMFAEPQFAASVEYADFWRRLNNGEFQSGEYRRVGKDQREVWINASYNPIFDMTGKPFKVVKYATVVTETKKRSLLISNAVGELTVAIKAISQVYDNTKLASDEAKGNAKDGEKIIVKTLEQIENVKSVLNTASKSLDSLKGTALEANTIVKVVNEISYKTELLALNASIEAARAGTAGKGFAVVAEEVGRLSEKTQAAISQVEKILARIQHDVDGVAHGLGDGSASSAKAVNSVGEAQKVISQMLLKIEMVDKEFGSIAHSINEQSVAVEELAKSSGAHPEAAPQKLKRVS